MKKIRILIVFALMAALFLMSTQVFASPPATYNNKKTPPGLLKTPGAVATQKAKERPNKQTGNPHGKHENYKGSITAVDAASITLELKDGSSLSIGLTDKTRIRIPSMKDATYLALKTDMTVMVQAIRDQDDVLTAKAVAVIPGKPTKMHHVGIVTAYEAEVSITIQAKDDLLYTFALTEETKILPAEKADQLVEGALVTIIAPRDVTGGDPTAIGIVIHPPDHGTETVE